MAKQNAPQWPVKITVGNVTVKVYRVAHPRAKTGFEYVVAWHSAEGRRRQSFADERVAMTEARTRADQLNSGRVLVAEMSAGERDNWAAAVALAGQVPLLTAVREWAQARDLTGGQVVAAAQAWAARNGAMSGERITVRQAIDLYIRSRRADGIKVAAGIERTFAPKRGPAVQRSFAAVLGHLILPEVTPNQLARWLEGQPSAVTRNTHRKRVVTFFRWCRKRGYLPLDVLTAAERTDAAQEADDGVIGIISPQDLQRAFALVADRQPDYLPALALAAFCGLRRGEVHGQRWEDMNFARGTLRVTKAKPKTPARRLVPLTDAALAWLLPRRKARGAVCNNLALDRVRDICRTAGVDLADNGFRHTWISAQVEITGDIPRVAKVAGTSVRIIHQHYLELIERDEAEAWFAVRS